MLRIKKIFTAEIAKLLITPQRKAIAIKRKIAQASQRRKTTKRRIRTSLLNTLPLRVAIR